MMQTRKFSRTVIALLLALCLCFGSALSVHAETITSDTVLNSYRSLISAYNTFVDAHESYTVLDLSTQARSELEAYYPGVNISLSNLYALGSMQDCLPTLDAGSLVEINTILNEDIAYLEQATAYINAQSTNSITYPAGNYKPGSVYGPKLTQSELNDVAEVVNRFAASLPLASMSDTDKVLAAHYFLVQFCDYAPDWSKNRANTAWGALVYGEAQCSGYARAMKALCDAIGIECYYVHADANASNPSHQWNTVKVDGQWYIIDVQCNDSSGFEAFLLVSDSTYANSTGLSWDRTSIPACPNDYTGTHYDYCFFTRLDGSYFAARLI